MLLILDIDGIMTDGTKLYDLNGEVSHKRYCDLDFTAIKRFKEIGWSVCFVSADRSVNESMAKRRGIDFYYSRQPDGSIDKSIILPDIMSKYRIKNFDEIVYVGDDVHDLTIMRLAGKSFCVMNSPYIVRKEIPALPVSSGQGVVKTLYDIIIEKEDRK